MVMPRDGSLWFKHLTNRHSYGAEETVAGVLYASHWLRDRFPLVHRPVIGDLSRRQGGHFPPHVSHQNGLDVDVGFIHKTKKQPRGFRKANSKNIDAEATWAFIEGFLFTGFVDKIFIGRHLRRPLLRAAKRSQERPHSRRARRRWRSRAARRQLDVDDAFENVLSFDGEHRNHFHVRFRAWPDVCGRYVAAAR